MKIYILCLLALWWIAGCVHTPSASQQSRIDQILRKSAELIRSKRFEKYLTSLVSGDFDHSSDGSLGNDDGVAVYQALRSHKISGVKCQRSKNPFNRSTKAWEGDGVPKLRCTFLEDRTDSQWVGTIRHEQAHSAGYKHDGNLRNGNECTVPHVVGDLATFVLQGEHAVLPWDACPALKAKIQSF